MLKLKAMLKLRPGCSYGQAGADTRLEAEAAEGAGDAGHLEGSSLVWAGLDRGETLLGDRGEGHPLPSGAPHRRRAYQVQAHLLDRWRRGQLRRDRQGI